MYYKKFYALDGKTPVPAVIRSYTEADFNEPDHDPVRGVPAALSCGAVVEPGATA